jgi:hypothetical protein
MKTKILIILSLLVFETRSQTILTNAPDQFCAGDSIELKVFIDGSPGSTAIRMEYLQDNGILSLNIWDMSNESIGTSPGLYSLKLETKNWWPHGAVEFRITKFDPTISRIVCTMVGIQELRLDSDDQIQYFDLSGNKVEPTPGKLLIQQIGFKRKKVYIQ